MTKKNLYSGTTSLVLLASVGLLACAPQTSGKGAASPESAQASSSGSGQAEATSPPPAGVSPDVRLPPVVHRELPNGLKLRVISRRQHPIVEIRLVVFSGQASDGATTGLAAISGDLLKEGGAGKWESRALLERVESLGSTLGIHTDRDSTRIALGVTSADFDSALEIVSAVAQNPRFSPPEFDKLRQRELERVKSAARGSPNWAASMALYRELYDLPTGVHPYANFDATPADLQKLTLQKCKAWHGKHFKPKNAELIVAGDVDANTVEAAATRLFGHWKGERPEAPSFTQPTPPAQREVFVVDRPGAAQSEVYLATLGPERSSEHWPALATTNQVLGGGPSSRLFLNVREKQSLAYRTNSTLEEPANGPIPIIIYAGTQTPRTNTTVAALLKQFEAMSATHTTEQEVTAAGRFLADSFLFRMETVGAIADMAARLAVLRLPDEYYDEYRNAVRKMTPQAIQATAGHYLRPRNLIVVVAGDAAQVAKPLSHFGKVTVLNPETGFTPGQQYPFDPNQAVEGNALPSASPAPPVSTPPAIPPSPAAPTKPLPPPAALPAGVPTTKPFPAAPTGGPTPPPSQPTLPNAGLVSPSPPTTPVKTPPAAPAPPASRPSTKAPATKTPAPGQSPPPAAPPPATPIAPIKAPPSPPPVAPAPVKPPTTAPAHPTPPPPK